MKIHFTYSTTPKDDFTLMVPDFTSTVEASSVDEISGDCLHQVTNLPAFLDECYRLLKPQGKAVFTCPHFTHAKAWHSPLSKRGLSEGSLNFADKLWREQTKFTELTPLCDFSVEGQFAVAEQAQLRSDEAKQFWAFRYNNVVEAILFTLTKRSP